MPPKTSNTLTEAELRLMKILWARGESTVADLVTATNEEVQLAYTSVLTTIRVLEKKGYVVHRQEAGLSVQSLLPNMMQADRKSGTTPSFLWRLPRTAAALTARRWRNHPKELKAVKEAHCQRAGRFAKEAITMPFIVHMTAMLPAVVAELPDLRHLARYWCWR